MKLTMNEPMVKRFSKPFIISHWIQAFSFIALYITALPLYSEFFSWMYVIMGSPETARVLHRTFAVIFLLPIIILLIFDRKSLFHWLKQVVTWKKNDFQFFLAFPKEFFVGNKNIPKQDFYNAGEKLNSMISIITTLALIVTGFIMWFPGAFSQGVIQWAMPIHAIAFGVAAAVIVAHIFLSIGHPNSKISIRGMIKGDVPVRYAKEHHEKWYDELVENGVVRETKKQDKGA